MCLNKKIIKFNLGEHSYIGPYEFMDIDWVRVHVLIRDGIKYGDNYSKFDINLSTVSGLEYIEYADFCNNYFGEFL